ncbi:MAG: dihydrolipoyllysine-residue succinyltransferase [Zetaproteobacteria bacterium]|nr:dihydrolipoyllysine-residue succinyltransferase [Zetaproteobacteria bacterium]
MALIEITVPSLGESESEATLVGWHKEVGDSVEVDDVLAEIESDKITMEITAIHAGVLTNVLKEAEALVAPQEVIGHIETAAVQGFASVAKAVASVDTTSAFSVEPAASQLHDDVKKVSVAVEDNDVHTQVETQHLGAQDQRVPLATSGRIEKRVPMTRLRKKIASHLKSAQNSAAMLTTFNEVNLESVMQLRSRYKAPFKEKHDASLGFMSFFVKAVVYAASKFPVVNAHIEGDDVIYHNYMDVGVAVSTEKGLVVPVLRDVGLMSLAQIEQGVVDLASRARSGDLMPDDMQGGTFSITNGGVFGSLLSTPILNPPQSAILGMHTIQKRVVVENDAMVIRPMMYLALTYDHRLIDGKDAVQFLVAVKEWLENPAIDLLEL